MNGDGRNWREEIAEIRNEQKWHRWLLIATFAASAYNQTGRISAPPSTLPLLDLIGRLF